MGHKAFLFMALFDAETRRADNAHGSACREQAMAAAACSGNGRTYFE